MSGLLFESNFLWSWQHVAEKSAEFCCVARILFFRGHRGQPLFLKWHFRLKSLFFSICSEETKIFSWKLDDLWESSLSRIASYQLFFFVCPSTWSTKDEHILLVCRQLQTLKPQLNNSEFQKQKRTGLFICSETALGKRGKKYLNALITDFIWNIATFRILVQIFMTSIALFTWCQCRWLLPLVMGIITETPSSFL